jgi:hypothetical protein
MGNKVPREVLADVKQTIRSALETLRFGGMSTDDAVRVVQVEVLNVLWHQTDQAPSDDFLRAVDGSGSLSILCEFCGRVYFCYRGDYDEGELEELQSKRAANPDKYIETDDFTSWGTINGKQFVIDCPCNGVRGIENWMWAHRYIIAEYFERRAKHELERAADSLDAATTVQRAVEQLERTTDHA